MTTGFLSDVSVGCVSSGGRWDRNNAVLLAAAAAGVRWPRSGQARPTQGFCRQP